VREILYSFEHKKLRGTGILPVNQDHRQDADATSVPNPCM
jgi:hypothetical protein